MPRATTGPEPVRHGNDPASRWLQFQALANSNGQLPSRIMRDTTQPHPEPRVSHFGRFGSRYDMADGPLCPTTTNVSNGSRAAPALMAGMGRNQTTGLGGKLPLVALSASVGLNFRDGL